MPKPNLADLLADYQKAKNIAIERLTELEKVSGADFRLADIKAVDPLKRIKLRFVRDLIDMEYRTTPNYIEDLVHSWNALSLLSQCHSAYYAAYCAENKDNE